MSWSQKTFTLPAKSRGSYLITDHIKSSVPEIRDYKVGMLNLFIQHTSCALSLNENWDEDVREDMSDALDRIAPEDRKGNLYRHSAEGEDDMPVCINFAAFSYTGLHYYYCYSPLYLNRCQIGSIDSVLILYWDAGTHQIRTHWGFSEYPDFERAIGNGDVAGDLVFGVPGCETFEEGCCYHPG